MQIIEFTPQQAKNLFDELPEPGDELTWNGKVNIIAKVHVVNNSKVILKAMQKRDQEMVTDPFDKSKNWEDLPDDFLDTSDSGNDVGFLDSGSLKTSGND